MFNDKLKNLRALAQNKLDESTFSEIVDSENDYDFEDDEEFIQECMTLCAPTFLMMDIMDESAEALDEDVRDAFVKVQDYLVGQGFISEAASVNINNPNVTVMKLSKQAQINRLASVITLKMARKANDNNYKKYKIAHKIKKDNREKMDKRYGDKAKALAKKLYQKLRKNGKVSAVVSEKKKKNKK